MSETYTISADGTAITCHRCTMTSYHPLDIFHRYCGQCRMFHQPHIGEDVSSADSLLHEVARLQADAAAALSDRAAISEQAERLYQWHAVSDRTDYGLHKPGCAICDMVRLARAEHPGAARLEAARILKARSE